MLVKMKHANHEEHEKQSTEANPQREFTTFENIECVREEMEKCNAEHDPGNQAEDQLNSLMSQLEELRYRSTK